MSIKIIQDTPKKMYNEVSSIVNDCFEGVWSAEDLLQLIEIPHENTAFMVAYVNEKAVGYTFVVADYIDEVDEKIATIQEFGLLPEYRDSEIASNLLEKAIVFSKESKANLMEQVVSIIDQWIIPTLIKNNLRPSEIKADREISTPNEAKLILTNLRKCPKLNVIMNQLFYENNSDLETHIIENEFDLDDIPRNDPIAFGSVISVDKAEDLENTLEELKKTKVEWDEIGITFDYTL